MSKERVHPDLGEHESYQDRSGRISETNKKSLESLANQYGIKEGGDIAIKTRFGDPVKVRIIHADFKRSGLCVLQKIDDNGVVFGKEINKGLPALVELIKNANEK